jgi:CobQ-like glutamine amidotransferase family enzyme
VTARPVRIVQLYGREMNMYGDTGNVLVLTGRLRRRGYQVEHCQVGVGDELPGDADIVLGGGGQDSAQHAVAGDLQRHAPQLKAMGEDGVAMLMVCGLYQQFGHHFRTRAGTVLPGIGFFDANTVGTDTRLIGNLVVESPFGPLVGYENHSGLTDLAPGQAALGACAPGYGNNGKDGQEGAVRHNVFGTYLHGPVLAKAPGFADELLTRALSRRASTPVELEPLDDSLERRANRAAALLKR